MSLKDKLNQVTRRDFLKGVSAVGATAAVYGCGGSGDGGKTYMEEDEESNLTPPAITETVIMGSTPHNCGGRCVSKYYVKDGVIKRITTDERPDKSIAEGDEPQYRSCVRCRSRKQWFYRNDRLLYPLKQTGERGDINGFVRISWEQAYTEIAQKMKTISDQYGPEAFHLQYASGDVTGWSTGSAGRLLNLLGGYTSYYLSYSSPTLQHVARFVDGVGFSNPQGNAKQDAINADNLVLWSCNFHESIIGTNSGWYLQQIKERGVPITTVDVRFSKTTATVADNFVDVEAATDPALVLAMLYRIIVERYDDVDKNFINNYVFGFFDNGNTSYHGDLDTVNYAVPAGGSLSAYVLGDDDFLVTKGHNAATSIYPDTIGYNVNTDDDLYGKTVSIWGQLPKTPEWAEKITGVPAAKIRELADMYLDTKVTTWSGLGYNRGAEAEQIIWLLRILSAVTKNFGIHGACYGRTMNNMSVPLPGNSLGSGVSNSVSLASKIYDSTRLTAPLAYVPTPQRGNLSVFTIPDAVENAGYAGLKSKWNDGQVNKITTPFKVLFSCGSNVTHNQHCDTGYTREIFKNKNKLELIVNMDAFLTGSAILADYVLPSAVVGEKPGSANMWETGEVAIKLNKIIDAPGEALDEYSICTGIAEKLGHKDDFLGGFPEGQEGMDARMRAGFDSANLESAYGMDFDEWSEKGVASFAGTYSEYAVNHKAYRANPSGSPLATASGKFEAYCLNMMEDYEARYHENIDTVTADAGGQDTLYGTGEIYSKHYGSSTARRFVYPIPMYIPTIEGRHAIDDINPSDPLCHDDPLGLKAKGYSFTLLTWHMMYRSHSSLNNIAYLNECYKKDADGNPAYFNPERSWTDGVWDDGVYEPIWINPADAVGIGVQNGDRLLVSNDRGKIYVSAVVTQRVPKGTAAMGQGGWVNLNSSGIDVGGCVSTVTSARPSRICKGNNSENDCRVKIEKA